MVKINTVKLKGKGGRVIYTGNASIRVSSDYK